MFAGIQIIETESNQVQKQRLSLTSNMDALPQISINSNEYRNKEDKSQKTRRITKVVENLQKKKKQSRELLLVEVNTDRGILSKGTLKYLEKRLELRCSKFYCEQTKKRKTRKYHSSYISGWGRKFNVKKSYYHWCILINIALFVIKTKRARNKKNHLLITSTGSDHVVGLCQLKYTFRVILSFCFGILIIAIIMPILLVFDLCLRGYAYINIYIIYCLSYTKCMRYLLLLIVPVYILCIILATIASVLQTVKATGELLYNMASSIVYQNFNLAQMIADTFKQPF